MWPAPKEPKGAAAVEMVRGIRNLPQHSAESSSVLTPVQTERILRKACQKAYDSRLVTPIEDDQSSDDESLFDFDETLQGSAGHAVQCIVEVGEDGTEVRLNSSQKLVTLQQQRSGLGSLLDLATPTPKAGRVPLQAAPQAYRTNPITPNTQEYSLTSQLCCGARDIHEDDTALATVHQESIEQTICLYLSGSYLLCDDFLNSWQAWSYFDVGTAIENSTPTFEEDIKESLRNRACDMHARSRRIRKLRGNMNPFGENAEKSSMVLAKTRSFCIANDPSDRNPRMKTKHTRPRQTSTDSSVSMGSNFISSVLSCTNSAPIEESPRLIRMSSSTTQDDDLCYDSDPEQITRQLPRRDLKKVSSFLRDRAWTEDDSKDELVEMMQPKRLDFGAADVNLAKENIHNFMNEGMTLVWYPRFEPSGNGTKGTPRAVKAWIEYGQQLRGKLIHPKLMWKPANDSANDLSRMGFSDQNLSSIAILDITRVVEVDRTIQGQGTLAKRTHSFIVQSVGQTVFFETSSEFERDRILRSLKLLIARLASLVITGNSQLFDEFYTPSPFGNKLVPGKAPEWA